MSTSRMVSTSFKSSTLEVEGYCGMFQVVVAYYSLPWLAAAGCIWLEVAMGGQELAAVDQDRMARSSSCCS